ncbi:uroporphyrinogen III synthase [Thalassospira sp. HJ]|uniref:uroporphyrinogen-III synthase n=1 Tax=Thalassospira sp. HJ TaxID=1616823 RepID=UPI0005CE9D7B|nr:uroporphyrinogen-III synthase [Thalassospira sp. HJ]KJE34081.1 uroporphyrinogen III synthase [Thalassospira sp. HJ]
MGPLVLNTRPDTDSADLLAALDKRGYRHLSAPLLGITFPPPDTPLDIAAYQGVVFTSANGVRAFAKLSNDRLLPAYCVGNATARTCLAFGFTDVHSANGDIHDLAALIRKMVDPARGPLFHPAARKTAGDLGQMLLADGYSVDRQTVYEANESNTLPKEVIEALRGHHVEAVLFFSPRTAETFVKLVHSYKLERDLAGTSAICLSPAVQSKISDLTWHRTRVASQPTQEYLLSELGSLS